MNQLMILILKKMEMMMKKGMMKMMTMNKIRLEKSKNQREAQLLKSQNANNNDDFLMELTIFRFIL